MHAWWAQILGYNTFESFCEYVYKNYFATKGMGRFVSTLFFNNSSLRTRKVNGIHISPWHTFKGYGQLNGKNYFDWLISSGKQRIFEGGSLILSPKAPKELGEIFLATGNLPGDIDDLIYTDIIPESMQTSVIDLIMLRGTERNLYLHDVSSFLFRWNVSENGILNDQNILTMFIKTYCQKLRLIRHAENTQ